MRRKGRGFTLVELSLIVVVLAVQFAVLMPMVEKNREEQRKTTCQDNLKYYALALALYWNDYDSCLPSSACVSAVPGSPTDAEVIEFITGVGDTYPPADSVKPTTLAQLLSDHMRDTNTVFCPSDTPKTRVSFWYKYAIDYAWRNHNVRKEGQYVDPAGQIAFYEHAGWHVGDAAGVKNGVTIHVAYMDLHVTSVVIKNGPTSYPPASDERTGESAVRTGEPMFYNYNDQASTYHPGVADYSDPRYYWDKF